MKVLGYMPLAYGAEYLRESLLSVRDFVHEFVVLYTPKGSQGSWADEPFPDTKEELYAICSEVLGSKMIWSEGTYHNEGAHRDEIYKYSKGYDLILTLDSDEVLEPKDVPAALEHAYRSDKRYFGVDGFINFWTSFSWCCIDGFRPIRIINLNNKEGSEDIKMRIYHFSTAQSERIVRFKWKVSGHKDELRSVWMDRYLTWPGPQVGDLHPTSIGLWNAVPFDKTTLPDILKNHPNYNKERIV